MIEERQAVIAAARTWLGTPHRHRQAVKGAGVDCAMIIKEAFIEAGLAPSFDQGFYTHDWHMHRNEEVYLETVKSYMGVVDERPLSLNERLAENPSFSVDPADVIMMRVGRTYSHGVIVSSWPDIIHAYFPSGMVEEVSVMGTPLMTAPTKIYSYWSKT